MSDKQIIVSLESVSLERNAVRLTAVSLNSERKTLDGREDAYKR